ncbi:MAG: YkgJ family cysteine cluster protein [Desulfobacterales bacterium]|nr:YkgJ family cysteine cluster protein [Desulfobacterales bacterium]
MPDFPHPNRFLAHYGDACADTLGRLGDLFDEMARHYAAVAEAYGFHCEGCADNCCRTRFFHHTLVEFLMLHRGVAALTEEARASAMGRAAKEGKSAVGADSGLMRVWCPLAEDGRCMIYDCRPMICRLHGLPHELRHPVRGVVQGPGCAAFDAACGGRIYRRLDRTPLYRRMAELEQSLRQATGFDGRIRMTVAEMVRRF